MASIRKRGENSYLLVVSRGYDYQGNRLKPAQKTVHPPKGLTAKQTEKWLNEQAVLYEREVKHTPGESVDRSITLAKYIDVWLEQVAPKKLAASTLVRDKQDIRRILPALGHYKLAELNKDILRAFYDAMRSEQNWKTGGLLAEKTVEGIHSCLCGILSDAVEAGYITHNPAWRAYRKKGAPQERPVADEETVQRLITALEGQSLKYEVYFKLILATGMRRGEACGLRWSDIDWRQQALHIRRNVVMKELQKLIENGENYLQYKPIHAELKKQKNGWTNKRDKYEEAHCAELTLWNAASRYLHANLTDTKTLPISKWKQEYADLKEQRDTDYTKLKATRAEVAELQKIRKCVDIALKAEQPEQTQNRTKRHDIDR